MSRYNYAFLNHLRLSSAVRCEENRPSFFLTSCSHQSHHSASLSIQPGEICYSWVTWADLFGLHSNAARAIVSYLIYLLLAVSFATCSAVLVQSYAPQAFHTGIPGE